MKATKLAAIGVIFGVLCSLCGQPTAKPQQAKDIQVMNVSDLDQTWTMEGRLKRTLGTVVTVEGTVIDGGTLRVKRLNGKALLRIEKLEGKSLAEPVVFEFRYLEEPSKVPKMGSKFQFVGFETGEFAGLPSEAFKHIPVLATQGYHFRTLFEVLTEKNVSQ